MQDAAAFMGEIELVDGTALDEDFGQFERLPSIQAIQELAREFAAHLELMPYQRVGEDVKLLVSVYLESRHTNGRVIAVLVRDDYPPDARALEALLESAVKRAELLTRLAQRFEEASVAAARNALERLYQKVVSQRSA